MTALAITSIVLGVLAAWSIGFHLGRAYQSHLTRRAYARIVDVAQGSIRGYETRQR